MRITQVKKLDTIEALRAHCTEIGAELDAVDQPDPDGPLFDPLTVTDGSAGSLRIGNRWCVLPMEGWDGTEDGLPTDLVRRRWSRFGASGAKLIWGGEAVAVRPEGRANPNQLVAAADRVDAFASLRTDLTRAHHDAGFATDDLVIGLQLTHSGRWSRPHGAPRPRIVYRHPALDPRVGADDTAVLDDDELDELIEHYVVAARMAAEAGFAFVDVKACHGYLLHESLTAHDRPGRYGGDLDGRSRLLRTIVERIRETVPSLAIGVRLSVIDDRPHHQGDSGVGEPDDSPWRLAFGRDGDGGVDLDEPSRVLDQLSELGVAMVCVTVGSPYYNPHVQRPAYFPPSDGYLPPEDPLVGVARQLAVTAEVKRRHPAMTVVGSGYTYLQQWLPHVGEAVLRAGGADMVGLGRMVLSYPHLPADVGAGRPLDRRLLCRTFSDCTTAPRNGLVSGCYPLDPFYKERPERKSLTIAKREAEKARGGRRR